VILLSPERLASDSFKLNVLQPISSTLGLLVIDEVHCISIWGHDFRPNYRRIGVALQLIPSDTPVLGTTATANDRVLEDVRAVMGQVRSFLGYSVLINLSKLINLFHFKLP